MHKTVPFIHRRNVKFGETDAAAIVYTPRFSDYCMEAAEIWFREYLDFDWYHMNTSEGLGTPIVHMEIDFKAPLRGGNLLAVEVLIERVGTKSLSLLFNGSKQTKDSDKSECSFVGRFVYCFTSEFRRGSVPMTDSQLEMIHDYRARGGMVVENE